MSISTMKTIRNKMSLTKKSKQTFNRDKSRDQERFNYLERLKLEFENPQTKKS